MNETVIQLVVQTGALGLVALQIFVVGKKLDKLSDCIMVLMGQKVPRDREREHEDMYGGTD